MHRKIIALVIFVATGLAGPVSRAAPVHDFHEAVAEAYAHYREARFYLRTGNPMVAAFGLQDMSGAWQGIVESYAKNPPGIYANDPEWQSDLADIGQRLDGAMAAVDNNDLESARKIIAPIRTTLSDLRARNGIYLYSDCIDNANAAMEDIWYFRRNPPEFDDEDQVNDLRRKTTIMTYWYERCRNEAPENVKNAEIFKRLVDRTLYSLGRMWVAISDRNQRAVINILREMRSSDRLLYLHFG